MNHVSSFKRIKTLQSHASFNNKISYYIYVGIFGGVAPLRFSAI